MRCELNGSVRNVGLASGMKNFVSFNNNESVSLENAGWFLNTETSTGNTTELKSKQLTKMKISMSALH